MKRMSASLVVRTITVLLVAALAGGCATAICSSAQHVKVNSTPPRATVKVNGVACGETPVRLYLKRDKPQTIQVELAGYQPCEVTLNRGFNFWVVGNVLIGGIIGVVVDALSGAIYELNPRVISAELAETPPASEKPGEQQE